MLSTHHTHTHTHSQASSRHIAIAFNFYFFSALSADIFSSSVVAIRPFRVKYFFLSMIIEDRGGQLRRREW